MNAQVSSGGVVAFATTGERERLDALRRYDVLDTPPDGCFDHVTALVARLFSAPIAIVSLVDEDRIWFKSHHGLDVQQIHRSPGLCASAILGDGPYVVTDAKHDPRTLANPLVAGIFGLQFYAAVPLSTHDGYNLGTLCVIDHEPRAVSDTEIAQLEQLATVVMDQMELRLSARNAVARLEHALHRTEMLGREIDHRVMNSLQFLVGMLDMQSHRSGDPETQKQLDMAARRILCVARVHRHFYIDETVITTDALSYLQRLCADFDEVLPTAMISVQGAPVAVATTKVMPLGIILNELVTNAAKNGAKRIEVRITGAAGRCAIRVSDDGKGLPPDFDPNARKGLGMGIVSSLVRDLEATLRYGPLDAGGAWFEIDVEGGVGEQ